MKHPNKFIIISTLEGVPWGGSEELWMQAAIHAVEKGFEVIVSMMGEERNHPKLKQLIDKGVAVRFVGTQQYKVDSLYHRVNRKLTGKQGQPELTNRFDWIEQIQPTKVLVNASTAISLSHFADLTDWMLNTSIPFDTLIQHHSEHGRLQHYQSDSLQAIFTKAATNFTVSARNITVLERQIATKIPNVQIVNNPVNLQAPKIIAYLNNDIPQIAVVARFDCVCKGQDILFEAIASELLKEQSFQVNLFGAGQDEQYLKKLANFYNIEHKVCFKGHVSDIAGIWKENEILLLPSVSEGTPISLVEAMLCGRAAIVTDVGDNARLIKEGETGYIVAAPTVAALATTINNAIADRAAWAAKGEKAFHTVKEEWKKNNVEVLLNNVNELHTEF